MMITDRHNHSFLQWHVWWLCLVALFPFWVLADNATQSSPQRLSFADEYMVSYITMKQGLRHNFIEDIVADSKGFIWTAMSGGGLSRYDGYRFVDFGQNSDTRKLKSNFLKCTKEDRFGRLWVAEDCGVDVIDIDCLETVVVEDCTGQLERLLDSPTWGLELDADGCIWIGNVSEIARLKFGPNGEIVEIQSFDPPYLLSNSQILRDVCSDSHVWTSIGGVISRLWIDSKGDMRVEPVSDRLRFPSKAIVNDFALRGGDIWIATDAGLWRYNMSDDIVKHYAYDEANPNSISQNFLTSLAVTPDNRLLVGSLRGLNVYNPRRDDFVRISDSSEQLPCRGLNNNFVNCIFVDGERIWVGTEGGGMNKFVPNRLNILTARNVPGRSGSIPPGPVNAIFQDSDGCLWIGSVEGGLSRTDSTLGHFDRFTHESGSLGHNSVSALAEDSDGHLWVGTWGGGIDVLDRRNPAKTIRHIDTSADGRIQVDYVSTLIYDSINNLIWIGCSRGLYICDPTTMALNSPFGGDTNGATGCVASVIDDNGHLWAGGNVGLYDIDLTFRNSDGTFGCRRLLNKFDDPSDSYREKVASLFVDAEGSLWIGTNGNGVYRRRITDKGEEAFDNYNSSDGLSSDMVLGAMVDGGGALWVGTYSGLSYRSPDGTFICYDVADGLPGDQFYWNASCRLDDGRLAFGTTEGLILLDKDAVRLSRTPASVQFTGLKIDGNEISPSGSTVIHESVKSLGIDFSALDYDSNGRGTYYYRLDGFDKGWIKLQPRSHGVSYTNLSPGSYTLKVKYVKPGFSADTAPVASYSVDVRPYFYRRWWFVSIMVLLVVSSIMLIHLWRVRDLTRQKLTLQKSVDERTSEISRQKRMLEERAVELSEQNKRLKQSNEEITMQKTRLADMARRVQELSVDRISFFTNITHEFRTPITLIIGPIERALKLSYNPQVIEQLRFAERNSRYLLTLVNQLMDFRKVESGKMEIVRNRGNFRRFITDVVEAFRPMTDDRMIDLRLICRLDRDTFSYDEEALRKVIVNLLGNAVKFTPDGGKVTVYAAIVRGGNDASGTSLYINVSDSGNGIAPADIDRVFERFYQGNSQLKYPVAGTSGSGIGLYLCKSIVEIYGGRIWARNNPGGRGCSFRLLLPVDPELPAVESDPDNAGSVALSDPSAHDADSESEAGDSRTTILVVEDNADMRSFIRSILADRYSVLLASNGQEALDILMSSHVDFIVSDLMMPVMDGLELSRRVKEDFAICHIPFLMLTARTSQEARIESFKVGVDEYLPKPFDPDLLLARIHNILENKRRQSRSFSTDMDVSSLNIDDESRDKKFMDQVMAVVRDNYKNSYFEVGDFAEALGISRSLLNKKLQSLVGQSAGQLMRSYRMNLARELLVRNRRTRTMNISEIAYEVGFNDSKYFTRCFTKQFGEPPSAFMADS
ncbi:MAG: response regulator [Muribaculum sp.]|nr:response regulator [Muribaculum sp.]